MLLFFYTKAFAFAFLKKSRIKKLNLIQTHQSKSCKFFPIFVVHSFEFFEYLNHSWNSDKALITFIGFFCEYRRVRVLASWVFSILTNGFLAGGFIFQISGWKKKISSSTRWFKNVKIFYIFIISQKIKNTLSLNLF